MKTQSDYFVQYVEADIKKDKKQKEIIESVKADIVNDLKDALKSDGRSFNTKHDAYVEMRSRFMQFTMPKYAANESIPSGYSAAQILCDRSAWVKFDQPTRDALKSTRETVQNNADQAFRRFIAACFEINSKRGKTEPKEHIEKLDDYYKWISKKNKAEYGDAMQQADIDAMFKEIKMAWGLI